jgi:hypothetical protein
VPALDERGTHRRDRGRVLAADVEDDLVGIDRFRSDRRSLEDEMRAMDHQGPILEAGWLTLRAVGNDDAPARRPLGDPAPLPRHREPRAATTQEAARLQVVDDPSRRARRDGSEAGDMGGPWFGPAVEGRPGQQARIRDHRQRPEDGVVAGGSTVTSL